MSLQGTLDTFALPDVLRLLSSARKSGHLRIDGSRGGGSVWCDDGRVVAAELDPPGRAPTSVEVVYELLRFPDGSFTFDAGAEPAAAGTPEDVEPLLAEAQDLLAEWREIEAVVPSLEARVALVPELTGPSVTVDAEQWRLLAAIGGGTTAADLGDTLALGELAVARAVKALVEAGLALVDATPDGADQAEADAPVEETAAPSRKRRNGRPEPFPEPADELAAIADPVDELAAIASPVEELAAVSGVEAPAELTRQLAQLGPDAARAVAAAAKAETPEERDAALATIEESPDGEPINRGLLLKFLSSVRS